MIKQTDFNTMIELAMTTPNRAHMRPVIEKELLRWLKQHGATINSTWVRQKISDYGIDDYPDKLDAMWQRLPDIIHGAQFKEEMARFIPMDVQERTLNKGKFYDFLVVEIQGLLQNLNQELKD